MSSNEENTLSPWSLKSGCGYDGKPAHISYSLEDYVKSIAISLVKKGNYLESGKLFNLANGFKYQQKKINETFVITAIEEAIATAYGNVPVEEHEIVKDEIKRFIKRLKALGESLKEEITHENGTNNR